MFNFKNKNLIIILLILLLFGSVFCYLCMKNDIETFISQSSYVNDYFIQANALPSDISINVWSLKSEHAIVNNSGQLLNIFSTISTSDISDVSSSTYTLDNFKGQRKYNVMYHVDNSNIILVNLKNQYLLSSPLDLSLSIIASSSLNMNKLNMLLLEDSSQNEGDISYNKIFDLSKNIMGNFSLTISGDTVISNGGVQGIPPSTAPPVPPTPPGAPVAGGTGGAGGTAAAAAAAAGGTGSSSIGDIFFQLGDFGEIKDPQAIQKLSLLDYKSPLYYQFESAMNLPSNPIVNPINSMNPLDYSETLFGPNVTPIMAKNSYLNENINSTNVDSCGNSLDSLNTMMKNSSQNSNNNSNNNCNNGNSSDYNNEGSGNDSCPPCPAPQRCPESNFECKKIPKYEMGQNNPVLPRPVLTDFSTFGM